MIGELPSLGEMVTLCRCLFRTRCLLVRVVFVSNFCLELLSSCDYSRGSFFGLVKPKHDVRPEHDVCQDGLLVHFDSTSFREISQVPLFRLVESSALGIVRSSVLDD
jgi:hypothetical protein